MAKTIPLTDDQVKSFVGEDGTLTIPKNQKKAFLSWLTNQLELLREDWNNPEVIFDSKLARKVALVGIKKIQVLGEDGVPDPKNVTNVSALLDQRGSIGFSSIVKNIKASVNRLRWQKVQTLDPKAPGYNTVPERIDRLFPGSGKGFKGHIHHRLPIYVLGKILAKYEQLMAAREGRVWNIGDDYTHHTKTLLKNLDTRFGIPTGNDWRNLSFIKKENIKLHDAVHAMWEKLGLGPEKLQAFLDDPENIKNPNDILKLLTGKIKKALDVTDGIVDGTVPELRNLNRGQVGDLIRKSSKRGINPGVTFGSILTGVSALGTNALADVVLDEDVAYQAGRFLKAKSEDDILEAAIAKAELQKEAVWAVGTGFATAAVVGKIGALKPLLANPYTAVPFITYAGINAYDKFLKGTTNEGLGEHYSKFQDKRAPLHDKIEAGDRLKAEPLQGEWGQGKNLNPVEKIGQEIKNRSALYKERFNPVEGEWGLSEILYGR